MGKLDEEPLARMVFHQIASGVAHAHNSNICHRDLKLDNVLLQHSGRLDCVKVRFRLLGRITPCS